jgi:hypothetical protein
VIRRTSFKMPLACERDDFKRRVVATSTGPFQAGDVFDLLMRQREDGTWAYGVLYDTRGQTGYPTIEELREFLTLGSETDSDQRPRGPMAFLATEATAYRVACAYEALGGSTRKVAVFRDRSEAEQWLIAETTPGTQ